MNLGSVAPRSKCVCQKAGKYSPDNIPAWLMLTRCKHAAEHDQ